MIKRTVLVMVTVTGWLGVTLGQNQGVCNFDVPADRVFEIEETVEIGTRVFAIQYHPEDAIIKSVSISGDLGDLYKKKFRYRHTAIPSNSSGVLELYVNGSLALPPYPSPITQASVRARVMCNGTPYPVAVIRMKAANRLAPWFYDLPYRINVSEASAVGSVIETPILAIDWDPAAAYTITYALTGGNENGTFVLEKADGLAVNPQTLPKDFSASLSWSDDWSAAQLPRLVRLRLLKPLDYDFGIRKFVLNVTASDNGGTVEDLPSKQNWTTLIVDVLDSNDLPPLFDNKVYHGFIRKDAPAGINIPIAPAIHAHDGDNEISSVVKYSVETDRWIANYFTIDPNTGAMSLRHALPSNFTSNNVDLIIKAEELDSPSHSATAFLHISVSSASGEYHPPEFLQCSINVSIPEKRAYGAFVTAVSAVDFDESRSGKFTYEIVDKSESEPFYLGAHSGLLTVVKPNLLNLKNKPAYHIQVRTVPMVPIRNSNISLCPVATVNIRLLEDDGTFRFSSPFYNFAVLDSAVSDTPIGWVHVINADSEEDDSSIMIEIEPRHNCTFDVHLNQFDNGSAQVIIADHDNSGTVKLTTCTLFLKAYGHGDNAKDNITRSRVVINVIGDKRQQRRTSRLTHNVTVPWNAPDGTIVVQASILFGNMGDVNVYRYMLNDTSGTFSINSTNGWITVQDNSNLSGEIGSNIILQVTRVKNGSTMDTAEIMVNIATENDNTAVMVSDHASTSESSSGHFQFSINRTVPVGTVVGQVTAGEGIEGQSALLRFMVLSAPPYFDLLENGTVVLVKPLPLKPTPIYSIIYQARYEATDPSKQSFTVGMAEIHVMGMGVLLDDRNTPRFTNLPNVVAISEALAVGSVVYTTTVSIPPSFDQLISIVSGNSNNTFAMSGSSVVVAKPLDAETVSLYQLRLQLSSTGEIRASDALTVQILDVNDNRPIFERPAYEFKMNSSSITPNYIVGTVKANDADISFPDSEVIYQLEGDGFGVFSINETTGDIRALAGTRRNYSDTYRLSVLARDRGQPPLKDNTVVTIHVLDVAGASSAISPTRQVSKPSFTQLQYSATIPENAPARDLVQVTATHPDHQIQYALVTPSNMFKVDPQTGQFSTAEPLDFERASFHQIPVFACIISNSSTRTSTTQPPMSGESINSTEDTCAYTTVFVGVLDENDNRPVFDQSQYEVRLPTDAVVGSVVVQVHATDNDSDTNADISYALKTDSSIFAINYETGIVRTVLSKLAPKSYELTVEAYDHGRPSQKGETKVIVIVNGTDPHAPEFEKFIYDVTIPENSPNGTVVTRLVANDPDPDDSGKITYLLQQTQEAQEEPPIQIDENTGEIRVRGKLDYETRAKYQLVVEAVDHAQVQRTGTTLVIINIQDVNDNPPIFDPLPDRIFVSSGKEAGSPIFHVRATDRDSKESGGGQDTITFHVDPPSPYFQFDQDVLKVKSKLETGELNITLVARDAGDPALSSSHSLIVVVMPDSQLYPIFPQLSYDFNIKRNDTMPETVHTFLATVKQGGVRYEIIPRTIPGLSIDEGKGELAIGMDFVDNATIDIPVYLIVRATNTDDSQYFSDVSVILTVTDHVGPSVPLMFPSSLYRGTVLENSEPGTYTNLTISVMEAESFGDKLVYWLSPNDTLTVDAFGHVMTVQPIDLESLPPSSGDLISVQAFASNGSSVVSTIVQVKVIDVDEFPPQFSQEIYHVNVSEAINPGETILKLDAIDEDYSDKLLRYEIVSPDTARFVSITSDGVLVKSDEPPFDREGGNNTVDVIVKAVDREGKEATAQLVIELTDANDNAPQFVGLPYIWNVSEGDGFAGQKFAVVASDADQRANAEVSFRILQGNSDGLFLVSPTNGSAAELSVVKALDREQKSQYVLIIQARDHGTPSLFSLATVTVNVIDVNDNSPKFFQSTYEQSISADFPVGFPILSVYAQDVDLNSNMTYSLISAQAGSQNDSQSMAEFFEVKPENGQVLLTRSLPLTNHTYQFKVEVNDGAFTDQATVVINVLWTKGPVVNVVNVTVLPPQVPPQFDHQSYNFSVPENVENATVGRIGFVDLAGRNSTDISQFSLSIEPEAFRKYFRIDGQGMIYNVQKLTPNVPDLLQPITFFVTAADNGEPPLKTYVPVSVTVLDENDHIPQFSQSDYVGLVPASEKANYTIVLDIRANDEDVGWNAKIKYSLTGTDEGCFSIDPDTALITLICNPDYYTKNMYNLQVMATDRFGEGNSSNANLAILVVPPVDVATEFPTPPSWAGHSQGPVSIGPSTGGGGNGGQGGRTTNRGSQSTASAGSPGHGSIGTAEPTSITALDALVTHSGGSVDVDVEEPTSISATDVPTFSSTILAASTRPALRSTGGPHGLSSIPVSISINSTSPSTSRTVGPHSVSTLSSLNSFPESPQNSTLGSSSPLLHHQTSTRSPVSADGSPHPISSTSPHAESDPPVSANTPSADSAGSQDSISPASPVHTPSNPSSLGPTSSQAHSPSNSTSHSPIIQRSSSPQSSPSAGFTSSLFSQSSSIGSSTNRVGSQSPVQSSLSPTSTPLPGQPSPPIQSSTDPRSQALTEHCTRIEFPSRSDEIVLAERTPVMTPIYVAVAKPPSSDRHLVCYATYSLSGAGSEYFSLNSDTGLMKVAKALEISGMAGEGLFTDSTNTLQLNLTATLPDVGYSTEITLKIRIERANEPSQVLQGEIRFQHRQYSFKVVEQQPIDMFVGEVSAIVNDTGGSPSYTVLNAADSFKFADPLNGTIVTAAVLNYDDPVKSYSFVIQASVGGKNDYATVTVDVVDVNNHPPTFSKTVYEFQIPEGPYSNGAIVGDVEATDKDNGANALVNYTIAEEDVPFRIETSGRLFAYGDIDREQRDLYIFHVQTTDGGTPPQMANATVNVTILDVNDNSPVFENFTDSIRVADGTRALTVVAQVRAIDADAGLNGHVGYRLLTATDAFLIDQDGTIRTVIALSAQKQKEYTLSVQASDLGHPVRTTVRNMSITVEGNPAGPHFPQDPVYQDVPVNVSTGTPILHMSAGNGSVTYAITGGNENRIFSINRDTGDIFFSSAPIPGGYTITVTATNATSGQTASASARIFVYAQQNGTAGGGNERSQHAFDQRVYSVDWPENTPGPAELTHVQSIYEREHKPVRYEILKGDQGMFRIEAETGVVYVQDRLDRENQSMFIMIIRARPTAPRLRRQGDLLSNVYQLENDEAILIVNVTDVNDNPPTFIGLPSSGVFTFTVPPGAGVRTNLGAVKAMDPDISSVVHYEILPSADNDDASAFHIDPDNGQLYTAKNLDSFEKTVFTIVVQGTDGLFRTNVTVQMYKAASDREVSVISSVTPEVVAQYNHSLAKRFSDLTGWTVSVDNISPLAGEENTESKGSQLFLSAFDRNRTISVDRDSFTKRLGEVLPSVQNDPRYSVLQLELAKEQTRRAKSVQIISGPEIALIVISGVVILMALLGVLFLLRWWNKREKRKVSAEYMLESNAHGKRPYEAETLDPKKRAEAINARKARAEPVDALTVQETASGQRRGRLEQSIGAIGRTHIVIVDSGDGSSRHNVDVHHSPHSAPTLRRVR